MPTWKARGFVIRLYEHDHPPLHVHVFRDGRLVARFDLENQEFMTLRSPRQRPSILRALRSAGVIGGK